MIIEVKDSTIDEILNTNQLVIIDFWAEWCNPCKVVAPILVQLEQEYKDIIISKVNIDENDELTSKYEIRSIPTILFIKNNKVVDKVIGTTTKDVFVKKISNLKNNYE